MKPYGLKVHANDLDAGPDIQKGRARKANKADALDALFADADAQADEVQRLQQDAFDAEAEAARYAEAEG